MSAVPASGEDAVTDIVVTKRMPFGVHYILGSAVGPACTVQFSIDGGAKFSVPAKLGGADGAPQALPIRMPAANTMRPPTTTSKAARRKRVSM